MIKQYKNYKSFIDNVIKLLQGRKVRYISAKTGNAYNTVEEAVKDNTKYVKDPNYRYLIKEQKVRKPKEYNIPFIKDKKVILTNAGLASGAVLSTNMLDTIAKHAEAAGLPINIAIALAAKESTLGNPTFDKSIYKILNPQRRKIYEWFKNGQHINNGNDIPERELINWTRDELGPYGLTMSYLDTKRKTQELYNAALEASEKYDDGRVKDYEDTYADTNVLFNGFKFYKEHPDLYNPGLPNYLELVNQRAKEIWQSPEIQEWYKQYLTNKKIKSLKQGGQIRKMQTAAGGPIYEEDWSDRWEPYAAKIGLAGDAIGLGAAATGVGIPIGSAIAAAANTPNLIIDGYQTVRDAWRAYKDRGASLGSAAWNGGELILDAAGLKILSNINKAAKAGVASEKYLTSTEKALDSKPWKRVGTGHGRVRARQSADHKRKYNTGRNKALEESNIELAKRGVRPTQGLYYQRKLTDEMAKRGYGVAVNDAIKSANRTIRLNLGTINGISGGTNLYHIFKKEKGGMLEFLKSGSGIHIKKKNRGKFTSYCGGKVTDECIRKAKASGNPTLVKRATFAANARKWKHKKGGILLFLLQGNKIDWAGMIGNFASQALLTYALNKLILAKADLLKEANNALKLSPMEYVSKYFLEIMDEENRRNEAIKAISGTTVNSSDVVGKFFAHQRGKLEAFAHNKEIDNLNKMIDAEAEGLKSQGWMNLFSNGLLSGIGILANNIGKSNNNVPPSSTITTSSNILPKLTTNTWTPNTTLNTTLGQYSTPLTDSNKFWNK